MKPESISAKEFIKRGMHKTHTLKYRNKKVVIDGITFDSIKEGNRYKELKLMETSERIINLELQVKIPIKINGKLICHYICDFCYSMRDFNLPEVIFYTVWEDVKSEITRKNPVYRIKKKLMKSIYGIDILET